MQEKQDFCDQLESKCENDCSGYGKCLKSKECYCDYFNSGKSCQLPLNCTLGQDLCRSVWQNSDADVPLKEWLSLTSIVGITALLILLIF